MCLSLCVCVCMSSYILLHQLLWIIPTYSLYPPYLILLGKTTFIRMMAGLLKSDEQAAAEEKGDAELALTLGVPQLNVR